MSDAAPGRTGAVDPDAPNAGGTETEPVEPVEPVEEQAELLRLADGLPPVIDTDEALRAYCTALAAGEGPVAIDAERASGYRYSNRAYLLQLRRRGAGTALIDPIAFDDLAPLQQVLEGTEWILHAATQDLPCLAELGLHPSRLFDSELAGRLLGYPRVGLGTLVESVLGFRMKKEHSAADWSTRPLPEPWLEYAALDVEVLVELRERIGEELEAAGKAEWAAQEFDHLRSFEPRVREEPWRRTNGMHRVRGRRGLGAVRALWEARDELARDRDVTPSRLVPDSAIVAAASAMPLDRDALLATKGFHGRGAERYARRWVEALRTAAALDEDDLPARSPRVDGPPAPRAWADRNPVAADRLHLARERLTAMAQELSLPLENLLLPDTLRRVLWNPPSTRDPAALLDGVVDLLAARGARGWQVALTAPVIADAVTEADERAARAATEAEAATQGDELDGDAEGLSSGEADGTTEAPGEGVGT